MAQKRTQASAEEITEGAEKSSFHRFKFDEPIPALTQGGRLAKSLLMVFLIFGFFNIQRALGCDSWGDWTLVWAFLLAIWVFLDACITVVSTQPFFQKEDRLKRYSLARISQILRIEAVLLGVAVIFYVGAWLF